MKDLEHATEIIIHTLHITYQVQYERTETASVPCQKI